MYFIGQKLCTLPIMGDNHKISSLLTQYSFQQLITEPTYMTEHSSSLLDLVMVTLVPTI